MIFLRHLINIDTIPICNLGMGWARKRIMKGVYFWHAFCMRKYINLVNKISAMFESFLTEEEINDFKVKGLDLSLERVAAVVLGGGQGVRLFPLTSTRCKPAITFGGRYSLIDVPISHSMNSGIRHIYVIGQYLVYSLQKHLIQTYVSNNFNQRNIQLLAPEEREGGKIWYKGTADAVRQNLQYLQELAADYFLILSGDQLYNIHFKEMVEFAKQTDADMVIATLPVNEKDAKRMGLLKIDQECRLVDFYEKPQEKKILENFYTNEETLNKMGFVIDHGRNFLGSMGIYLFKRQALIDLLLTDPREDFGKHLIISQMNHGNVRAFLYDGYWEDIGTIDAYYKANLALTRHDDDPKKGLQCYDERNLIFTKAYNLPGAKISHARIVDSIVCEGSIIEADEVIHSIVGVRSIIKKGSQVKESIIMGNEYYQRPQNSQASISYLPTIGQNCLIHKAIIDENAFIGNDVQLINREKLAHFDSPKDKPPLYVRDGIIVIPRGAQIPNGYIF